MEDGIWILLNVLFICLLVFLNGFFVASECAIVKVRESRLAELANQEIVRAKFATRIKSRLDAYLSACQFGTTLSSIVLGFVGVPAIADYVVGPIMHQLGASESIILPLSVILAIGIIVFMHFVFGQLAPKMIGMTKSEQTTLWLSGPLIIFYKLFYPFVWLLSGAVKWMLGLIGIRPVSVREHGGHTEEEILSLLKESYKNNYIDEIELELVENVFDFSELVAREIMIPRTMIDCLYTGIPFEENLRIVQQKKRTRYPVVGEDKDHLIGWVHAIDIYDTALEQKSKDIRKFIRPLKVVSESMEISEILKTMQQERIQMVVVVDEYGGTSGLITLDDVLREIVGVIHDDINRERDEIEVLKDRSSLDARMLISEINELFQSEIDNKEVDTIGGWMYAQFNEPPQVGHHITQDGLTFTITEMEHLRIKRIEVNAIPWRYSGHVEREIVQQNMNAASSKASPA